jgi:hypothetical protein
LPHRFNRTGGLEDKCSLTLLVVELGLGAPVDIADNLIDGLLQLTTRSDLVGSERNALRVLAGDVHGWESRATGGNRLGRAICRAIGAVGGDRRRLLAPGRRNGSLSSRLDGAESREGLLGLSVERGLLRGGRRVLGLLLASSLLAERSSGIGIRLGGGRRMGEVLLVGHVLDSDMVVGMFLHKLLRRGQTLGGRASDCFRCHG